MKSFSDEELLQQIRDKAKKLGRIPKITEVDFYEIIIERFGKWTDALRSAGFDEKTIDNRYIRKYTISGKESKHGKSTSYVKYTDEELLQQIIDKYKETGKIPTTYQVENYKNISRRFNGWENALLKAGFNDFQMKNYKIKYTKKELLYKIKEKSKELNRVPTIKDMENLYYYYCKNFDTWKNALLEAGFDEKDISCRRKKYTNEELLKILKEKYVKLGKIPKTYDIKQYNVIVRRFGSFNEALKEADLI